MLEVAGKYNKISDQLRADIKAAIQACGNRAEFRFDISSPNPSGDPGQPKRIWGSLYELTPITFQIIDPYTHDPVWIGIVDTTDEKGIPTGFKRIKLTARDKGIFALDLTEPETWEAFAVLYLHPKHTGGRFANPNNHQVFVLINEVAEAKQKLQEEDERLDALNFVRHMNVGEIKDFASAYGWDDNEDPSILKNKIRELADKSTSHFTQFAEGNIKYKATIKRAIDKKVIEFVPVENTFRWAANKSTIVALERGDGTLGGSIKQFADWLVSNKNGEEIYDRIAAMLKPVAV